MVSFSLVILFDKFFKTKSAFFYRHCVFDSDIAVMPRLIAVFGNIGFVNESLILYRQHGNNSVGAKNVHSISYLMNRLRSKPMRKSLQSAADQADAFFSSYDAEHFPTCAKFMVDTARYLISKIEKYKAEK